MMRAVLLGLLGIALGAVLALNASSIALFFLGVLAASAAGTLLGVSWMLWARQRSASVFIAAQVAALAVFALGFWSIAPHETHPALPQDSFLLGCREISGTVWHARPSADCAEELARIRCSVSPESVIAEYGTPAFPDIESACELYVEIERARVN